MKLQYNPPLAPSRPDFFNSLGQEATSSGQLVEQRFGVFEVGGIEALGEPAVDRREQVPRGGASA